MALAQERHSALVESTSAEAAGRFLIVGFEGRDFSEVAALIKEVRPAGLIFFTRNYDEAVGPSQLRELIDKAQSLAQSFLGRRLLIAVDYEGGRVQRFRNPYTLLPPPQELSALEPTKIQQIQTQGARQLAATGFNVNLAPVVDLATNSDSPIVGDRSFSADPACVALCAQSYLAAYENAGLVGALKHFPGLGAASLDPHYGLPTIALAADELMAADIFPFQKILADQNPWAVMTTHALYPALDSENPATTSESIVSILKNELSFPGVVLSDDMEMGAVLENSSLGEMVVKSVVSGHDLILVCRQKHHVQEGHHALLKAIEEGIITPKRRSDAYSRLVALLEHLAAICPAEETRNRWFTELLETTT